MAQSDDFFDSNDGEMQSFDLDWVLGVLRRRIWWAVGVTVVALVPAIAIPLNRPAIYQASARVLVRERPQAMNIGDTDYMPREGSQRGGPLVRDQQVAYSDAVLGRVVDQAGGGGSSGPVVPTWYERFWNAILFQDIAPALSPAQIRKSRIEGLKRRVSIDIDDSAAFLIITANSFTPENATWTANAVADAIVEYKKEGQRGSYESTVSWLNTQVLELRERISGNQEAQNQHLSKYGIVPEQLASVGAERSKLTRELTQIEIELQIARSRLRELETQRDAGGPVVDSDRLQLEKRYEAERAALTEARLAFTPTHPEIKRREGIVANLEEQRKKAGPIPLAAPSLDTGELKELIQQESKLRGRRSALQRQLELMTDPSTEKTRAMGEYERMQRQLELDRDMLSTLMRKRDEVVLVGGSDYTTVQVLDRAIPPVDPITSSGVKALVMGIVLAFGAGAAAALGRELIDPTVRDPDAVSRLLGVGVIGMVPLVRDGTPPERQSEGPPSSLTAESYRNLRTALLFSSASQGFTTLVVTSGIAGEGKTTVSANLASSFAQSGRSVLLIDADMRRPRVQRIFSVSSSPGLAELLRGEVVLEAAVRRPNDGRFDVLTAGKVPPNPSELIASPQFAMLLARVRTQYDLVILDSPVLLGVSDTQLLSSQADATLIVHRPGTLAKGGLRELRSRLDRAHARILGVVFNQVPRGDRHFYPSYMESPYLPARKAKRGSVGA